MKKKAKDLKVGDKVTITGKNYVVQELEISDIGKQGTKKVRLVLKDEKGEKNIIVRPEDYPFEA